jgi:phage-related protein
LATYKVQFYQDSKGRIPVKEFIDSLPVEEQAAIVRKLELLVMFGWTLNEPHVKKVRGKLFELRVKVYRILFFTNTDAIIILLHAVLKRQQKLNPSDIDIAERRMNELR